MNALHPPAVEICAGRDKEMSFISSVWAQTAPSARCDQNVWFNSKDRCAVDAKYQASAEANRRSNLALSPDQNNYVRAHFMAIAQTSYYIMHGQYQQVGQKNRRPQRSVARCEQNSHWSRRPNNMPMTTTAPVRSSLIWLRHQHTKPRGRFVTGR